jgi:archaellum component FlaC
MTKKKKIEYPFEDPLEEQIERWIKKADQKYDIPKYEAKIEQLEETIKDLVMIIHYLEFKLGIRNGNDPV